MSARAYVMSLAATAFFVACAKPLAERFADIETGITNGTPRTRAVASLGLPAQARAVSVGSAEAEWAEWVDGDAIYAICFIQGRAVIKAIRPAIQNLPKEK